MAALKECKEEENNETDKEYQVIEFDKWDELKDINKNLLRGIYAYGFENPSAIQKKSIVTFSDGKDLIAQAQSGTGKTGAFAIGLLNSIDISKKQTQAMVLSPTRELSKQSHDVITQIGMFMKGLKTQLLIGGTEIDSDIDVLKKDVPHIIIGCPGRTHDMLRRRSVNNNTISKIWT